MSNNSTRLNPLDLFDVRSELTDDECMVKDTVARFVDEQAIPLMREAFEQHRFPEELVPQVAELGLLGSSIEGYDCAGLNAISYGLICQELERGDSGLRSFVSVQSSLVMYPIFTYGSEEQKQRWLPAMARGEAIGCFGLTEPQGGSDPGNMKTHAKRDGDDWILNGSKMWITNGNSRGLRRGLGDDRGRHQAASSCRKRYAGLHSAGDREQILAAGINYLWLVFRQRTNCPKRRAARRQLV